MWTSAAGAEKRAPFQAAVATASNMIRRMPPLRFDVANPDPKILRQAIFARLRDTMKANPHWQQIEDDNGKAFERYLTLDPQRYGDPQVFARCVLDVFWQFVGEGILAPGINLGSHNCNLPWFHITPYGHTVIATGEYQRMTERASCGDCRAGLNRSIRRR
jgi:hypothetical protein